MGYVMFHVHGRGGMQVFWYHPVLHATQRGWYTATHTRSNVNRSYIPSIFYNVISHVAGVVCRRCQEQVRGIYEYNKQAPAGAQIRRLRKIQ